MHTPALNKAPQTVQVRLHSVKSLHLPYIPKCLNRRKGDWKNFADYGKKKNYCNIGVSAAYMIHKFSLLLSEGSLQDRDKWFSAVRQ